MKTKPPAKPRRAKCVNPDCPTKGLDYARGLCELCYRSLRYMVLKKKVLTWDEAENRGLCRKPKPAGSRRFPITAARLQKAAAK